MTTKSQKNSFVSIAEQVQLLNNNSVEIVTKLNDIVSSQDSSVSITQTDEYGVETTYSLPTVGKLQADINEANENIKRLAGMNDNNVHIINGTSTKKVYLSDLNREPNKIDNLNEISTFKSTNNWFFESLMNPTLSAIFDVTDKVGSDVDGVISRRYIVKFEKDEYNEYTETGLQAKQEFIDKFVGSTDIKLTTFLDWHTNTTNTGIINNTIPVYDEQLFQFEYQEVENTGTFSVLKQEVDTINSKLWFHIFPYTYTTIYGTSKTLKVGDEVVLNKQDSVTRWEVLETSSSSSNFRIRLERIEGFDPIPTMTNALKIYSDSIADKDVKVTVGFDEYLVVFMKPTNSMNRLKGSVWSNGTGLYTNDLILDTDDNISMSQYYLDNVFDYGNILKDLTRKRIPSVFGIQPNAVNLDSDVFEVVQINKHLTNNTNSYEIKNLHNKKNTIKTKTTQVNAAITQKNQELAVTNYSSVAERSKAQNELTALISEQESLSSNLYSITTQINSITDTTNDIAPIFRIRGFWDIPDGKVRDGCRTQEIVQFKIQYRYSAKSGTNNPIDSFSTTDGQTGYYSNWVSITSPLRTRTYDEDTMLWEWDDEDVTDADTPNINQLDIPITYGEKVEIRIKSISEVGYPDALLESEWSDKIEVEFPEELNTLSNQNEYINDEAKQDSMLVEFNQTLTTKGITRHVQDSFFIDEEYVAHTTSNINTSYKDDQGDTQTLKEYLAYLTDKIDYLEAIVTAAKGSLKVTLYNGVDEVVISNGSVSNINISLQNYGITTDNINYNNDISIIKDFYIKLENMSSSGILSFLVSDSYDVSNGKTTIRHNITDGNVAFDVVALVDTENDFVIQEDNQFIYFCDNYQNNNLYNGSVVFNSSSKLLNYEDSTYNCGLDGGYKNKNRIGNTGNDGYPATGNVVSGINEWKNGNGVMGTIIAPQVNEIDDLFGVGGKIGVESNESITIPLNIYWIFKSSNVSTVNLSNLSLIEHNKSIRARLHPSSTEKPFDFVINFNIKNKNI